MLTPLGFSLLRQLSDGDFHSGEDLAASVGLTRARVSQFLKQAETAGLALERVRGRGYRLLATPDFLDAAAVRCCARRRSTCEVARADAKAPLLPAANDDDLVLPAPDAGHSHCTRRSRSRCSTRSTRRRASSCVALRAATSTARCSAAEWQTRRSRPPRPRLDRRRRRQPHVFAGLALRAGRRLRRRACRWPSVSRRFARSKPRVSPGVELKWPNDLVHRHLKVGGILVELNGDALGPVHGRGRRRPQRALPLAIKRDIAQPVSDLTAVAGRGAPPIDRNRLLARLTEALATALGTYAGRASRRSRSNGNAATPTRASRSSCCYPMAPASRARLPASTARVRWCSPTARAALASWPAKSRCGARKRISRKVSRPQERAARYFAREVPYTTGFRRFGASCGNGNILCELSAHPSRRAQVVQ